MVKNYHVHACGIKNPKTNASGAWNNWEQFRLTTLTFFVNVKEEFADGATAAYFKEEK